jgi:peptidyl-dipeptidase A
VTHAELVAACDERLRPLETASNAAWWDANVRAGADTEARRVEADVALSDALGDPDVFAELGAAVTNPSGDPLLDRILVRLEHEHIPHQIEPELRRRIVDLQASIESRFASHRPAIDGEPVDDNTLNAILRTSDDTDQRRAAWEAAKTVGAVVADDVRELVRCRNAAARSLGYRDHFALALATTDFDEANLFATLDQVEAITREPFRALKARIDDASVDRFGVRADQLRPWHYDDPFFQEPPAYGGVDLDPLLEAIDVESLTERTFAGMGLDVGAVLGRSDLLPREHKVQHAFCIDIDRAGDVRVLANCVPGTKWTETMLHEFGHAVYFEGVGSELPWFLRTMDLCVTEGVAMRCGRLVHDPDWLHAIAGVPRETVDAIVDPLAQQRRADLLVFARWVLVMTHFERGLYADPDAAHDDRWWDLVERYQLVPRPDGRHAPDWAAKIHIAAAPVYYHNYLFGELIASQLTEAFGSVVDRPDAGRALANAVFIPGATLRWDALVTRATGRPLAADVLARDLAR